MNSTATPHFLRIFLPILLIGGVVISLAVLKIAPLFLPTKHAQLYIVERTETGFSPAYLSIHPGDTVTFTTHLSHPFWPASNPHPSHIIYPEFDPKHAVTITSAWSFRFDRVGIWGYHDHLDPFYEGTISVGDTPASFVSSVSCSQLTGQSEKAHSWDHLLHQPITL